MEAIPWQHNQTLPMDSLDRALWTLLFPWPERLAGRKTFDGGVFEEERRSTRVQLEDESMD